MQSRSHSTYGADSTGVSSPREISSKPLRSFSTGTAWLASARFKRALTPLWDEGILRSEHGRGTFVQRIPPPRPEASDEKDAATALDAILTEIAVGLAQLSARLEAARALLEPQETSCLPEEVFQGNCGATSITSSATARTPTW